VLLPHAIARVDDVHGRRFPHPVVVGVYATSGAYAMANGLDSTVPVGVAIFGRVHLSDGGAELVSEEEARTAIQREDRFTIGYHDNVQSLWRQFITSS
jgi:hypothetical protein